jgi:hypothetical protein
MVKEYQHQNVHTCERMIARANGSKSGRCSVLLGPEGERQTFECRIVNDSVSWWVQNLPVSRRQIERELWEAQHGTKD